MKNYLLGLYEKSMPSSLEIEEKLAAAKEAGFDYMELSIDESDEKLARLNWDRNKINSVRHAIETTGVPIYSICLSGHRKFPLGHPDKDTRTKSLEIMDKAVSLAADLGVRIIQLAGYDVYYEESTEETVKYFGENLAKSVDLAARKGVILAFETMETEFINTVEKAVKWVDKINSPYLQVYPDIGNITNAAVKYGTSMTDDLLTGKGHISAVHLKETVPGVFREVPFGEGHVDFESACKTSFDLGVRMFVGEFWYKEDSDWKGILTGNNKFLRDALGKGSRE